MKTEYRVMGMDEIKSLPWNGFNVISTFSGCGGSSLGYRMAGFRVLWASEFIDAARECYNANKAPYTIVDGRDVRKVSPEDILSAISMKQGELDLLDGSPPCASFSTAGKRESGWGKVKKYSDKAQRTDDLFFEFARLVRGVQPKTFVAENVSGLVKGTAKGYFLEILKELKECGYRVKCRVLDAQWLGVPQARQRTIFVGVRNDLKIDPVHPEPLSYRYSIRDAIPWIDDADKNPFALEKETKFPPCIENEYDNFKVGEASKKYFSLVKPSLSLPCPTVTQKAGTPAAGVVHPLEKRKFTIAEVKRICAFPDDFVLTGSYAQKWERCGRAVPPVMMSHIAATIRDRILRRIDDARDT